MAETSAIAEERKVSLAARSRNAARFALVVAGLAGGTGACGGRVVPSQSDAAPRPDGATELGDAASESDAAPIALADLCVAVRHEQCLWLMQCTGGIYRDLAHCEAEVDCLGVPQLQADVANGSALYDAQKMGSCDARLQGETCDTLSNLYLTTGAGVIGYCEAVTGLLKSGDACLWNGECSEGLWCDPGPQASCPGTCVPAREAGQACQSTFVPVPCGSNLLCTDSACNYGLDASPQGFVCAATPQLGEPCVCGRDCGGDSWCNGASNTCEPAAGEGAPCGHTADHASVISCKDDLWCDQIGYYTQLGVCRKVSAIGGPCSDTDTGCAAGLRCAGSTYTTLGSCVAAAAIGAACTASSSCQAGVCDSGVCSADGLAYGAACCSVGGNFCEVGPHCAPDLICVAQADAGDSLLGGVCAHNAFPGDPCDGKTAVCANGICRNGTCVDHARIGQTCMAGSDCISGSCVHSLCVAPMACAW